MLLLKTERIHVDTVRILDIWDKDGFLNIKIENNETGQIGIICQRIGVDYHI